MASEREIEAALKAYNATWDAARDIDTKTVDSIRRQSVAAALIAAEQSRPQVEESLPTWLKEKPSLEYDDSLDGPDGQLSLSWVHQNKMFSITLQNGKARGGYVGKGASRTLWSCELPKGFLRIDCAAIASPPPPASQVTEEEISTLRAAAEEAGARGNYTVAGNVIAIIDRFKKGA